MPTTSVTSRYIYKRLCCFFAQIYQGNNDQNSVVLNTLMEPIEARFIRLHPYAWYGHISMRMELYGCSLKQGKAGSTSLPDFISRGTGYESVNYGISSYSSTEGRGRGGKSH